MANKYILNPDGTISKYVVIEAEGDNSKSDLSESFGSDESVVQKISNASIGDILLLPTDENTSPPALDYKMEVGNVVDGNVDLNSFGTDDVSLVNNIFENSERISSFGFVEKINSDGEEDGALPSDTIKSFKPFNSFGDVREEGELRNPSIDANKPKVFADEFEILGGVRLESLDNQASYAGNIFNSMFSYFAEVLVQILIIEAIVLANRAVNFANGQQNRTAERYTLRIGKYDYTEYDLFTRYVYNVLNYPHDNSNLFERVSAFFVGFTEWIATDTLIDFKEIIKETTTDQNELDFLSSLGTKGDRKIALFPVASELIAVVYAVINVLLTAITNSTSRNRANLLIRKFYQEKHWSGSTLYSAKEKEDSVLNFFTELNYYYLKFYIERVQIGLKIIKKYLYDDSYLRGREKDSPLSRVSALRSNRHIDYEIKIFTTDSGDPVSGDLKDTLAALEEKIRTEKADEAAANSENEAIKAANALLPDYLQMDLKTFKASKVAYSWHNKHSDGDFGEKITQNKKPGQTTRIRALPQLFSMHPSLYQAIAVNGKASIELGKDLMQNFYKLNEKERRIPDYVVAEVENVLEAEYMPFYFHDIRTNEILSFHAFIESITDSFNPEYNSSSGFGRIDDVRTYVKTTRNINLSFTLAATSESDHDLMWYQINKIVAMVYPQWSDGFHVLKRTNGIPEIDPQTKNPIIDFKYPFTQVPTASPLIRLRVGDVIKSNYSRTNLSRLHGVGERTADAGNNFGDLSVDVAPFHRTYELMPGLYRTDNGDKGLDLLPNGSQMLIPGKGAKLTPRSISVDHPVVIHDILDSVGDFYEVEISNPFQKKLSPEDLLKMPPDLPTSEKIIVVADASKIIVKEKRRSSILTADGKIKSADGQQGTKTLADDLMKPFKKFDTTDSKTASTKSNNPITKSYESGMSRGLAGFITQLDVNYNEVNWETSRIGSKAPMLVKITVNFAPIHDIPPGLDHNGMLRAPVYNIGRINNEFFGDPRDASYTGSGRDMSLKKYKKLENINSLRYKNEAVND